MDQQLKFNILAQTTGTEGVEGLKTKFSALGEVSNELNAKLLNITSATYLFEKGIELVHGAIESFTSIIEMGDNLAHLSEKTGVAADVLSQFEGAAKSAGIPIEVLEKSLKKFTQGLGDLNNTKFRDSMEALGISTTDTNGKLKSSDVVLKELADSFNKMQDGPNKAALAVQIFGKAGSDIIPLLNLGSKEIEKFGFKMGSEFPENAKLFNEAIAETKKLIKEQQLALFEGLLPVLTSVVTAWNDVSKAQEKSRGTTDTDFYKQIALDLYTAFKIAADALDNIWLQVRKEGVFLKTIFEEIKIVADNIFDGQKMAEAWKQGNVEVEKLKDEFAKRAEQRSLDIYNFDKGLIRAPDQVPVGTGAAPAVADKKAESELDMVKKFTAAQQGAIDLERTKAQNYDLTKLELAKLTAVQEINTKAEKESASFKTGEGKAAMKEATALLIEHKLALIDIEEQQKKTWQVGAKAAMRDYLERARDVAAQTQAMFSKAFQGMEDALVSFVKTGKLEFTNLANAIIDDLIRIAVRQAAVGFLTAGVSLFTGTASAGTGSGGAGGSTISASASANGNVITRNGPMSLQKFANGGVVNQPHVALFGEAGAEAFVPLPDGRSIPVSMKGGGGDINVTVIYNAGSGEESTTGANDAQNFGRAISAAVKAEIMNQKRPGGVLS